MPKNELTKKQVSNINNISTENVRRIVAEASAKKDSVYAASAAKFSGKDLVDQARAGNEAANVKRKAENIPSVVRYRQNTGSSYPGGDKYSKNFENTIDTYFRTKPLVDKEFKKVDTGKSQYESNPYIRKKTNKP